MPQFVHSSTDETTLCFHTKKALEVWTGCKQDQHMLQKYIVPCRHVPYKLRVYWKALEGPKYYAIQSYFAFPKARYIMANSIECNSINKYQHSLNKFPYAGQILKSSFSPFMPQKSEIRTNLEMPVKKNLIRYQKGLYIAKTVSDHISMIPDEQVNISVKKMMDFFVETLNFSIGKQGKKVATELVVDFIQDQSGEWFLLKCRGHKYDYLTTKNTIPLYFTSLVKKSILNVEFARGFFESIIETKNSLSQSRSLTLNSFSERLNNLKKGKNLHVNTGILSISESVKGIVNNYMQNPPVIHRISRKNTDFSTSAIENASKEYDDRIARLRNSHQKSKSHGQ